VPLEKRKFHCPYCALECKLFLARDQYNLLSHLDSKHREEADTTLAMKERREKNNRLEKCSQCNTQVKRGWLTQHKRDFCSQRVKK